MREVGATELELGDVRIKLSPRPPAAPGRALSASADEASAERAVEAENDAEDAAEAKHYAFWRRVTRSSGAPIPPYKATGQ